MKYTQSLNYRKRKRFIRRVWTGIILFILVVCGGIGFIYYQSFKASNYNSPEQLTSALTTSYVSPNIQIFRSPYFQFQTDNKWSENPSASTENTFAYRNLQNGLLMQELYIYVNKTPPNLKATRALAVELSASKSLAINKVTDYCGTIQNARTPVETVKLDEVTFKCHRDTDLFNVVVGEMGKSTDLVMTRPDGSQATYVIYYSDVTATPTSKTLEEIVSSFQTR